MLKKHKYCDTADLFTPNFSTYKKTAKGNESPDSILLQSVFSFWISLLTTDTAEPSTTEAGPAETASFEN